MAFATSTLLYLEYCWKTKGKEKIWHYHHHSGLEDNCSTYFENRVVEEVSHTFPQVRSIPWSEDVNEHGTVCAFSFFSCLIQGLQVEREIKKHAHTTTHPMFTIHNYPGIFVSQVILHNLVFTSCSLWIQIKRKFINKPIQVTNHSPSELRCRIRWFR